MCHSLIFCHDFFLNRVQTNTYQLVIASDGGESYIVMIYDKIDWIQGTGKNPNMPDAKAQAGLISGNGPHFSLRGSGTDQVTSLNKYVHGFLCTFK